MVTARRLQTSRRIVARVPQNEILGFWSEAQLRGLSRKRVLDKSRTLPNLVFSHRAGESPSVLFVLEPRTNLWWWDYSGAGGLESPNATVEEALLAI